MSLRIVQPAEYLAARTRVESPCPAYCTPKNVRTLTNSDAVCFLAETTEGLDVAGFYLMPDGFPRGTFGLSALTSLWLREARNLAAPVFEARR